MSKASHAGSSLAQQVRSQPHDSRYIIRRRRLSCHFSTRYCHFSHPPPFFRACFTSSPFTISSLAATFILFTFNSCYSSPSYSPSLPSRPQAARCLEHPWTTRPQHPTFISTLEHIHANEYHEFLVHGRDTRQSSADENDRAMPSNRERPLANRTQRHTTITVRPINNDASALLAGPPELDWTGLPADFHVLHGPADGDCDNRHGKVGMTTAHR